MAGAPRGDQREQIKYANSAKNRLALPENGVGSRIIGMRFDDFALGRPGRGRPRTRWRLPVVLPSFTEFYRVLPGLTGFYRVLPSFIEFYWVLPCFTEYNWLFTGLNRILPSVIEFY